MKKSNRAIHHSLVICLSLVFYSTELLAATVENFGTIAAEATIYEDATGDNGGGYSNVCVGNQATLDTTRHAYILYTLPAMPEGATLSRVRLALFQESVRSTPGTDNGKSATLQLHLVTSSWSEGAGVGGSDSPCDGGENVDGIDWVGAPGNEPTQSATEPLPGTVNLDPPPPPDIITIDTNSSTNDDQLINDILAWYADPGSNHGWRLRVEEETDNARVLNPSSLTLTWTDATTDTFTIGGNVSGLAGTGLVLQNNDGDNLPIATDGSFTFVTALDDGTDYSVTVLTQPSDPNQTCNVSSGSGTLTGANVTTVVVNCTNDTYTIGGNISGLSGTGLVLQNNTGDDLPITADGGFVFVTPLNDGSDYSVTILTQPSDPNQTCNVSSGSGTLAGANVTTVAINCTTETFTIGGTVSGLAGTGLVLQNNNGDNLPITDNGGFTFATALDDGSDYIVTVLTQPTDPKQTCNVSNGSGTLAGGNVTDVAVSCTTDTFTIGGNVSGLSGTGLVLQNNAGDNLPIATGGSFTFATALNDGSDYSVTVLTQPSSPEQTCNITNGSGTLTSANVTDVTVSCTTDTFTIGGNVSGLAGTGLVLQNNDGDNLPIAIDGSFTFATALDDGSDYMVTVLTQPTDLNQTCSVSNGSGSLAGGNVTDVTVSCTTDTFTIGGTVSGLSGSGLVLQNNNGDNLPITINGSFIFATALEDGSDYTVTVQTQPTDLNQTCSVSNGNGTLAGGNITDVTVSCTTDTFTIGGTVSGLAGTGLVLQNNNGDNLPITINGSFTFATALDDGSVYIVTVLTPPGSPDQNCNIASGSGTLAGANVTDVVVSCSTDTLTIGGTVSGLSGSGLILQNNNGDNLPITTDGSFTFANALDDGTDYSVTVLTQPSDPNQTCNVSSGSGTLAGANVTTVVVNCTNDTYTIGGNISGLSGTGLELQNNAGDDLPVAADGGFVFVTALNDGSDYSVTVLNQPSGPEQTCNVTNGSGTLTSANVTDVTVSCTTDTFTIGGNVSGLTGTGLVLQNNDGDNLPIAIDGSFTFATALDDGSDYMVTVLTQPTDLSQTCSISNGSGTMAGGNVTNVTVSCTTDTLTIGGNISGLSGTGLVLQNNTGDDLPVAADGGFIFVTALNDGSDYIVTVLTQPSAPEQTCSVSNGSGTLAGADIVDISVSCVTKPENIFADSFEE